eukprot:m.52249 g.52249  ORF g.52249 m.52249 type:complete len:54 (-) comp11761_c1_seq1:244-405(-)
MPGVLRCQPRRTSLALCSMSPTNSNTNTISSITPINNSNFPLPLLLPTSQPSQ